MAKQRLTSSFQAVPKRAAALGAIAVVVVLIPLAIWSLTGLETDNDVEKWLPSDDRGAKVLAWYHDHFRDEERFLVTWDGNSMGDERVEEFASALAGTEDDLSRRTGGLECVEKVATPGSVLTRMIEANVDQRDAERRLRGVLIGPEGPVDQAPVALSIVLSDAGLADLSAALSQIRAAAESVGIPEKSLHMGGPAVARSTLDEEVELASWNVKYPLWKIHKRSPILLSAIAGVLLALFVLRSVRLGILVLTVSLIATLFATALVPITGGTMNMVLMVMPTLMMVLTLSGSIHVANYWKHAAAENPHTAAWQAMRIAARPCALASLTTAIGLASLLTSPLAPVRDFGLYSTIGCLISLAMVVIVLPSCLYLWPARILTKSEVDHPHWRRWGRALSPWRTVIISACLLVFVLSASGLTWFHTESKVIHYFPNDSRIVQDYVHLEENLAGTVPVEVVVRFDETAQEKYNFLERTELVRAVEQRIRQHPEISGTMSLPDFLPVTNPPSDEVSYSERHQYHVRSRRTETRVKRDGGEDARGMLTETESASEFAGSDGKPFAKSGDEVWRITAQVATVTDLDYERLTSNLDRRTKSALNEIEGVDHVVTGMVPLFLRTQNAVLDSLIRSFALAFGVIAIVLMVLLRHPVAGLLSMLPNLFPIGLIFGLISWAGMSVDIGTMITASVALGIAADDTLHLLTWFQRGIAAGLDRASAVSRALVHCGPAMFQTSAVVGLGLLMLCGADLLLIQRFGWMMGAIVFAAFLADVILLAAQLTGLLGRLIARSTAPAETDEQLATSPALRSSSG